MPYEQIDRVSVGSLTAEIISDSGCLVLVARDENLMVLARLVNAALTGLVGESTRVLVR